jgi:hypothetical protein
MGIRWQAPEEEKPAKNIEERKHICGSCKNRYFEQGFKYFLIPF